jgi:drug/metabolite transporter (DMT)-like permease
VSSAKLERVAPALFVALWSTGFIVARYGTRDAGPFTFLTIRLFIAAVILFVLARFMNHERLTRGQVTVAAVVGLCMHALYLGGVFFAVSRGLPSGITALIAGTQPVLTATAGRWLLQEKLSRRQWIGVAIGLAGVLAVVVEKSRTSSGEITAIALVAMAISVFGMASGTLLQRARGGAMPLLSGTAIQYVSAGAVLLVIAVVDESWYFENTAQAWLSTAWAVLVLSLAAVLLMLFLLARQAAARVSSLFFLTPALSTVEGALLFDERLGMFALVGLIAASVGVYLTTAQ